MYVMLGVDDDVLVTLHGDDFGVAVGVTAVVDEARKSTLRAHQTLNTNRHDSSRYALQVCCNWEQ